MFWALGKWWIFAGSELHDPKIFACGAGCVSKMRALFHGSEPSFTDVQGARKKMSCTPFVPQNDAQNTEKHYTATFTQQIRANQW